MLLNKEILTGLYGGGKTNITFNIGWNTSNAAITAYDPLVNENDRPRINTWKSNGTYVVYMSAGYQVYNPVTKTYSTPWGDRTTGVEVVTIPVRTTETAGVDLFIDDRLPLPTLTPDIANWVITDTGNPNEKKYQYSVTRFDNTLQYVNIGLFERLVWTGLGSNNDWSTSTNWSIRAPQANDSLQFAGTTRSTPFNNLPVDTTFTGIAFDAGSTAFQLNGNRFVLTYGSITNNSSNTQQINTGIVLGVNAGTINCATSSIFLNGNISGSGTLTKTGSETLTLSGNNSYTGNTYISAGIISVLNNNALGTGSVNISSTGIVVPSTSPQALTVINNPINILNTPTGSSIVTNKNTQYKRLITSNGPAVGTNIICRISVGNNATVTYTGGLSSTGATNLITVFDGTGTHIISSVPVLHNSVFQPQGGRACTMIIAVSGNRMNIFKTNSNVLLTVPFAINNTGFCIFGYSTSPAIIALSGDQVFTNMGLQAGTSFAESSGNNIFNNTSTFVNLTANATTGSSINTYVGSISGNINLIKTGTGTLTLSGGTGLNIGPRYTGFTAISAGTLTNYALSSNPSNKVNFARFTNTTLTVDFTTPPTIGDSFILLPARTVNLYPSVTLQNASGRTGSYDSTNSTLTIS